MNGDRTWNLEKRYSQFEDLDAVMRWVMFSFAFSFIVVFCVWHAMAKAFVLSRINQVENHTKALHDPKSTTCNTCVYTYAYTLYIYTHEYTHIHRHHTHTDTHTLLEGAVSHVSSIVRFLLQKSPAFRSFGSPTQGLLQEWHDKSGSPLPRQISPGFKDMRPHLGFFVLGLGFRV